MRMVFQERFVYMKTLVVNQIINYACMDFSARAAFGRRYDCTTCIQF